MTIDIPTAVAECAAHHEREAHTLRKIGREAEARVNDELARRMRIDPEALGRLVEAARAVLSSVEAGKSLTAEWGLDRLKEAVEDVGKGAATGE